MRASTPTTLALLLTVGSALAACTPREPAAQRPPVSAAGGADERLRAPAGADRAPQQPELAGGDAGGARAHPKTIMTGDTAGTYIRIGSDIAALAGRFDVDLAVQPSAGSIENVEALLEQPHTPFAIVQSDVLDFIRGFSEDPELREMAGEMRMIFPLYDEEVHILARPGVETLADLTGKWVAVGEPDSGTLLTATLLLARAGVRPEEAVEIGTDKALRALREGRVDAMFYVAGQPVRLFAEEVTAGDDLHLVPITEPDVLGLYPAATIRAGAYPWLEEGVPTVAVRAMLMTYDYSEATPYMREACQAVAKVARIVRDNVDWLRRSGRSHPKWRAVDLDAELVNWERSRCAEAGLTGDESYALVPGPEEVDCEAESNARRRMLCRVKQQMALQRQVARTRPESETGAAGATAEGPRYVAMDPVNLRAAPRDASDVLTVVEAGDVVRLIGRRGGWARVEYTDRLGADYTGWVHSRYLGRVNVPPEEGHKEEGGEPAARDGG